MQFSDGIGWHGRDACQLNKRRVTNINNENNNIRIETESLVNEPGLGILLMYICTEQIMIGQLSVVIGVASRSKGLAT